MSAPCPAPARAACCSCCRAPPRKSPRRAGLTYSKDRLTTDAGYNATLGAAFLGEQLGRFDGSYVLTFAGYNAGPRRAREWIARYGDPRGKDIDAVVDWIERIPFTETRSYVQRVMENYRSTRCGCPADSTSSATSSTAAEARRRRRRSTSFQKAAGG